jgi:hypothetical protein
MGERIEYELWTNDSGEVWCVELQGDEFTAVSLALHYSDFDAALAGEIEMMRDECNVRWAKIRLTRRYR